MITEVTKQEFQAATWGHYQQVGRHDLPWRQPSADGSFDPYQIMVSEIMLQQTQVNRVIPKYQAFLEAFPTVKALAKADLAAVLRAWSGLGYNRRAKFLHQAAGQISAGYQGKFPSSLVDLVALPGIGSNTAGAILAYAYNQPVVFIETNIRTVYIHHFFSGRDKVADTAILELAAETLDREHPREWYWALMDYGSHLKKTVGNVSRASCNYAKQSVFQGSRRQIRGQVIRLLGTELMTQAQLQVAISDERLDDVLQQLVKEGLIRCSGQLYSL